MSKLRSAGLWITETLVVRRWQAVVIAGSIGLIIAGGIYYYKLDASRAAEQRADLRETDDKLKATDQQLADAIKRLARLESPTKRERRKELKQLLDVVTPSQARRVANIIQNGVPPSTGPQGPPGQQGPRGNGAPPDPPIGGINPPNVEPPDAPNPPGGGGNPPGPMLDVPPFDLDGDGPLPPIDLPPVPRLPLPTFSWYFQAI